MSKVRFGFAACGVAVALTSASALAMDFFAYEASLSDRQNTQSRNGRQYENTAYEDLKVYFDDFCQNRASSPSIGQPVAFVGAVHLNTQFRTCDGAQCLQAVLNPNKPKSLFNLGPGRVDPLFVDLGDKIAQMEAQSEYENCEKLSITSNVYCLVGFYGTIRKKDLDLKAFKGNARQYLTNGECVVEVDDVVFGAAQNRNSWVLKAAVQGALDPFGNQTGLFAD